MKSTVCLSAVLVILGCLTGASSASAQAQGTPHQGEKVYQSFCIVCHGPAGEGGPLGKTLTGFETKARTDDEIIQIITEGQPGTGMSGYGSGLTRDEIFWAMIYIRKLQGDDRLTIRGGASNGAPLPDRPIISDAARRGEKLFNGEAGCIECHSYYTRGGFVGPDLSMVAARLKEDEIRASVLQPSAAIASNHGAKELRTNDGKRVSGRFRDETVDTIQIMSEDGMLWTTYFKSDIAGMRDAKRSLMPATASELPEEQLEELLEFLGTLK